MEDGDGVKVKIWGVRGAFPMTGAEFAEFGGNTSCVSADFGDDLVIFDAGSGVIALGDELAKSRRYKKLHMLISHLHLDHIQGLLGFKPLFDNDFTVNIYGAGAENNSFADMLKGVLGSPYWPVGIGDLNAEIREFKPGDSFAIGGGIKVNTLMSNHPNGSVIYRVEKDTKSIVYTLDCEAAGEMQSRLCDFAENCGLLIWDANYTEEDFKPGWGHSTWREGIETARKANAKNVLMTHYDRDYTDAFLYDREMEAMREFDRCIFAKEGMEITI